MKVQQFDKKGVQEKVRIGKVYYSTSVTEGKNLLLQDQAVLFWNGKSNADISVKVRMLAVDDTVAENFILDREEIMSLTAAQIALLQGSTTNGAIYAERLRNSYGVFPNGEVELTAPIKTSPLMGISGRATENIKQSVIRKETSVFDCLRKLGPNSINGSVDLVTELPTFLVEGKKSDPGAFEYHCFKNGKHLKKWLVPMEKRFGFSIPLPFNLSLRQVADRQFQKTVQSIHEKVCRALGDEEVYLTNTSFLAKSGTDLTRLYKNEASTSSILEDNGPQVSAVESSVNMFDDMLSLNLKRIIEQADSVSVSGFY